MPYVDGFVLPVPLAKLAEYRRLARKAGKIWIEHGALKFTNASPTMCSRVSTLRFRRR
jgi:uncharacterized protein YbaA (DUF1428 family)